VITHLDTVRLTDLGDDRVEIRGVRGSAPPATTKVAITAVGGWENSVIFALTGIDLDAKGRARRAIRAQRHRGQRRADHGGDRPDRARAT